ncbi:MAG: hypothetical protein UU47_C0003G0044 [candidate division TM6 bacterium GW2011_GWE2_41_16]|nr:MAG: hypothetical protein UU47_C0003G0044 [candidate division TM6 bacterium GW2011_GWE2_41_16]
MNKHITMLTLITVTLLTNGILQCSDIKVSVTNPMMREAKIEIDAHGLFGKFINVQTDDKQPMIIPGKTTKDITIKAKDLAEIRVYLNVGTTPNKKYVLVDTKTYTWKAGNQDASTVAFTIQQKPYDFDTELKKREQEYQDKKEKLVNAKQVFLKNISDNEGQIYANERNDCRIREYSGGPDGRGSRFEYENFKRAMQPKRDECKRKRDATIQFLSTKLETLKRDFNASMFDFQLNDLEKSYQDLH